MGKEQLFIALEITPPLLYLMERTERGRLLEMRWKSGKLLHLQRVRGKLYLGRALPKTTAAEIRAIQSELIAEVKELSPQVDEKEMRLYIIPQKILCSSYSDQALHEEQKF